MEFLLPTRRAMVRRNARHACRHSVYKVPSSLWYHARQPKYLPPARQGIPPTLAWTIDRVVSLPKRRDVDVPCRGTLDGRGAGLRAQSVLSVAARWYQRAGFA